MVWKMGEINVLIICYTSHFEESCPNVTIPYLYVLADLLDPISSSLLYTLQHLKEVVRHRFVQRDWSLFL